MCVVMYDVVALIEYMTCWKNLLYSKHFSKQCKQQSDLTCFYIATFAPASENMKSSFFLSWYKSTKFLTKKFDKTRNRWIFWQHFSVF